MVGAPSCIVTKSDKGIPNNKVATWIKLAVVHFGLFVGSNALAAGIYKGVDYFCNGDPTSAVSSKDDSVGENKGEECITKEKNGNNEESKIALTERQSFTFDLAKNDSLGSLAEDPRTNAEIVNPVESFEEDANLPQNIVSK